MARDYFINGETLVRVKGRSDCAIAALSELGLSEGPIKVSLDIKDDDIILDAHGDIPGDVQINCAACTVSIPLIHLDRTILDECVRLGMGAPPTVGQTARAGQRLGNNLGRFAPSPNPNASPTGNNCGNNYIGLNLTSPVGNKPWRFFFAYMMGTPMDFPLGAEKSVVMTTWRAINYMQDPYNGGVGAYGASLWDYSNDT